MDQFTDRITKQEIAAIDKALGQLIFSNNLSFSLTDSVYFKKFIRTIRLTYEPYIPGQKKVCTTILDSEYNSCIESGRSLNEQDCSLLIDGWKNDSANLRTFVSMIHSCDGKKEFAEAFDISGTSETGNKLLRIVEELIKIGKEKYNVNIYAVVSDSAANMLKMGRTVNIWHSNCSSHTGNLFAKDVVDAEVQWSVQIIIKELKKPDLEQQIVKKGGKRMMKIADTRWCIHCDAYKVLIDNLPILEEIAICSSNNINKNVIKLILDDDLIDKVKDQIKLLDPICEVINISQRADTSVADTANAWLNLKLPESFQSKYSQKLRERHTMALNIYAMAAYFLHLKYNKYANDMLKTEDWKIIQDFLIYQLNTDGVLSLSKFISRTSIFEKLFEKNLEDPVAFWTLSLLHHSSLSKLALKLICIPASSAQLERLFSQWAIVHCPIRNRLSFEKSKKLAYIYYTLRSRDNLLISDEDIEDLMNEINAAEI